MSEPPQFDVFLAHNSQDKILVEEIADSLKEFSLRPWLDKNEILGGDLILDEIQRAIQDSKCAAFFIGINGLGPWQKEEKRNLIRLSIQNGFRVIPVLLPGVEESVFNEQDLTFLSGRLCLILKDQSNYEIFLENLVSSIKGKQQKSQIGSDFNAIDEVEKSKKKLKILVQTKGILEQKLEKVESEIASMESILKNDVGVDMKTVLDWLSRKEEIAKNCCKYALKKFQNLKQELDRRNETGLFFIEIDSCLEFVLYALRTNNKALLNQPGSPILVDEDKYEFACSEIYRETFSIIKKNIPPDFELSLKERLEEYIDYLLSRLLINC
jgi:TIR domain